MSRPDIHGDPASLASPTLPTAVIKRSRSFSWLWLLPLAALLFSGWLMQRSWSARGVSIVVRFAEGRGLRQGAEVRYRGIRVGEVRRITLTEEAPIVRAIVSLDRDSTRFARQGARYWVVRPEIGLGGVRGIETLVGPRYIAALPGEGEEQRSFVGLEEPVLVESRRDGDLEIVIESTERSGLAPSVPITFRGVRIGTILSVGLSNDARTVEARAHVEAEYAPLVRSNSRFYPEGGISANWGSKLLWMELGGDLLQVLAGGSVVLATPSTIGEGVEMGHRFRFDLQPDPKWLEWQPSIAIGGADLPSGSAVPRPFPAILRWTEGRFLTTRESRRGWVLPVDGGLLAPADLLTPPTEADRGSAKLEFDGKVVPLRSNPKSLGRSLAWIANPGESGALPLPSTSGPTDPVDALAYRDRADAPLPLAPHRMSKVDGGWSLDPALSVSEEWHGAPVVERSSGRLLGVLIRDRVGCRVALIQVQEEVPSPAEGAPESSD